MKLLNQTDTFNVIYIISVKPRYFWAKMHNLLKFELLL